MTDYRELLSVSELSKDANEGEGVKVAVLDTGVPSTEDILVCLSGNMTSETIKDSGHATFIGSILFGHGKIKGICPKATACFIKVFDRAGARPEAVARAIDQAVDSWKIDIINMSLGFSRDNPCSESLKKACARALEKGVVLVAAAGNDGGKTMWPAALPGVISVGSTNGVERESFSNYGEVDFVVPGRDLPGQDLESNIVTKSGTSYSSAIITGLLTLMLAKRRRSSQEISPALLKRDLVDTCTDLLEKGWDDQTGYGFPFAEMIANFSKTNYGGLRSDSIFDKIKELISRVTRVLKRRKK